MQRLVLVVLVMAISLVTSCAQGVPVPADFPVLMTLPPGSVITTGGMLDEAAKAMPNSKIVRFSCDKGEDKVGKYLEAQFKKAGFARMNMPGMTDIGGNMFSKDDSSIMLSYSSMPGSNEYMLMSMEIPKFPQFGH